MLAAVACGPKRVAPPPTRPAQTPPALIVLLPDPDTGVTGRARVSNEFGAEPLNNARAATRVTSDAAPSPVTTLSEGEVQRMFGDALAALPPPPRHFTLYFRFESEVLTEESATLIPEVLRTVRALAVPEVVVIGHTDTMGDAKANRTLGLRRAQSVKDILIKAGLPSATVEATSHGETDLLVKTGDNVAEPKNRRVEITVR